MGRIEDLANRYYNHIAAPWQRNLAGDQKTIFVVYPKVDERKLRFRIDLFEASTIKAGYKWKTFNFTDTFARWMIGTEYSEIYFDSPEDITMKLRSEFLHFAAGELRQILVSDEVDDSTVVGVYGAASLYGFTKVSLILKEVVWDIKGRLLLFFPGEYENHSYRLLDARDGWNYLAIPITLHNGLNDD